MSLTEPPEVLAVRLLGQEVMHRSVAGYAETDWNKRNRVWVWTVGNQAGKWQGVPSKDCAIIYFWRTLEGGR